MRESTQYLEKMIKAENPIWLTIIIGLFILALAFILSPTSGAKVLDLFLFKKRQAQKTKLSRKHFLNHSIFDFLDYRIQLLAQLDLGGNTARTDILRDMLYLMFTTYKTTIRTLISEGINVVDKYDFKRLVQNTVQSADKSCNNAWLTLDLENIEQIIKEFNRWQSQSMCFTHFATCNVCDSDIYDDNLERMEEILSLLEARFRVALPDIEKGLTLANGIFSELDYKTVYFK